MTSPWLTLAVIIGVVAIIVWLWDDLTEELHVWVARDAAVRTAAPAVRTAGHRPRILGLVAVNEFGLVTPRGVAIPPEWLDDAGIDLEDALGWLAYVEALG